MAMKGRWTFVVLCYVLLLAVLEFALDAGIAAMIAAS
jgi:preprotein translocase subunit SecE